MKITFQQCKKKFGSIWWLISIQMIFVSCSNTSSEVKTASQGPETCKMAYEYEWEHIYDRKVYIPISCCKCVE